MSYGGLDIGTSNVKFAIYAADGTLLSISQSAYGNNRQTDPNQLIGDTIWNTVKHTIRRANLQCSHHDPLRAISVSSFGEAVVPIDRNGRDICPAFLYTAPEGKEELEELLRRIDAEQIQRITGVMPSVIFPPIKLNWYRNHTDVFDRAVKFLQFEDYIVWHLTGETCISLSLASRSMTLDIEKGEMSDLILEHAEIDPRLLSTPVPSGTFIGTVQPHIADELALPHGVRVYAGGHDQMCGMIGAGAIIPGTLANASGTVECISTLLSSDASVEQLLKHNVYVSAFTKKDAHFSFVGTPAGCAILDWFRSLLLENSRQESIFQLMEQECTGKPSPVAVVPYMAGRGVPRRDTGATGSFLGLKLSTSRGDIYQAIMESLAFEMRIIQDIFMDSGICVREIHATGGGSRSDLWMQLKADIYNHPVVRMESSELSALGCAMIAATADGVFSSLDEAAKVCVKKQRTFEPNPANARLFDEKYREYMAMWNQ